MNEITFHDEELFLMQHLFVQVEQTRLIRRRCMQYEILYNRTMLQHPKQNIFLNLWSKIQLIAYCLWREDINQRSFHQSWNLSNISEQAFRKSL